MKTRPRTFDAIPLEKVASQPANRICRRISWPDLRFRIDCNYKVLASLSFLAVLLANQSIVRADLPQFARPAASEIQDVTNHSSLLTKQDSNRNAFSAAELQHLRAGAEKGNVNSEYLLARAYDDGNGVALDPVEALRWYRRAAEHGSRQAQFVLGACYAHAEGVPRDYQEAMKWYRKSAAQGFPPAMNNIGVLYLKGLGLKTNYVEGIKWFQKAAELNLAPSQVTMAVL